jgi:hypothetical protein
VKLLACMLTVRLPICDRSGNYSARALRSTGVKVGTTGGMSCPSAMVISSFASISAPHCISSCCYVVSSSLLLIRIGMVLQVNQKSVHTTVFVTPKFYTQQSSRPAISICAHTEHLNTAQDCVLICFISVYY